DSLHGRRSAGPARGGLTATVAAALPRGENPVVASPRPLELEVGAWLDELARGEPTPGGGSALACAVAMAAAVLTMAARISGDPGVAAQADALRARAAPLVREDSEVYADALSVRERTAALEPEQRDWAIGRAFAAAAEPPLELARVAADVAGSGDQRVRADAVAAAALAAGAARGAVALVAANLTALPDDERIVEV